MAKFNPILGTLSGRVGTEIYAYNKGGYYTRTYVKQHWAGTQAQINAKTNFALSNAYWLGLTSNQRAAWNVFATKLYSPLAHNKNVEFSAQQAAIALFSSAKSCNQMNRAYTLTYGATGKTPTTQVYAAAANPPVYRLENSFTGQDGKAIYLSVYSASLDHTGTFGVVLNLNRSSSYVPLWHNPGKTEYCGFQIYVSNPIKSTNSYFRNLLYFTLGATTVNKNPSSTPITAFTSMTLAFTSTDITLANYKAFPVAGQKVKLTVFLVSQSGQKAMVGSKDVIVS